MRDPDVAVAEVLRSAERLFTRGYGRRLRLLLREGDLALSSRLGRIPGGLNVRFSEARAILYRQQVELVTQYITARLQGFSVAQAQAAAATGYAHTVSVMRAFESNFTGISQPMDIEKAAMRDAVLSGSQASLLRSNRSSWRRYGSAMVNDFERVIRTGLLSGASNGDVIRGLVSVAPKDLAERLNKLEPTWFPNPRGGFVARQYWAERIVRTEKANAYNEANFSAIDASREQFPDMGKKILAVGDRRTAFDSIAVHGQIRPINGLFRDGAGREYLRPPARPNDRETVVPWRTGWKEREHTRPFSAVEKKEMEAAKRPKKRTKTKKTVSVSKRRAPSIG